MQPKNGIRFHLPLHPRLAFKRRHLLHDAPARHPCKASKSGAGGILDCVLIARCDVREIDLGLRMCELWWLVIWAVSELLARFYWYLAAAARSALRCLARVSSWDVVKEMPPLEGESRV